MSLTFTPPTISVEERFVVKPVVMGRGTFENERTALTLDDPEYSTYDEAVQGGLVLLANMPAIGFTVHKYYKRIIEVPA